MQEAVPVGEGSMIAVLGVKSDEVKNLLNRMKILKVFVKLLMIMQKGK